LDDLPSKNLSTYGFKLRSGKLLSDLFPSVFVVSMLLHMFRSQIYIYIYIKRLRQTTSCHYPTIYDVRPPARGEHGRALAGRRCCLQRDTRWNDEGPHELREDPLERRDTDVGGVGTQSDCSPLASRLRRDWKGRRELRGQLQAW
jgi:hypothetical protein